MQYVWNFVSWIRCATAAPPVNPSDAPTEPPKESKTLSGWRAWAAGTKRKEPVSVPEEAKPVIAALEEAKPDPIPEETKPVPVEETKPEPAVEESKPAPVEEAAPTVEETKPTVVEESTVASVTGVATTLETIPEDSKEFIPDNKKKVEENGASEEKELGSDFTPHN